MGRATRWTIGALAAAALAAPVAGAGARTLPLDLATDGPGALSHFDLARKDCLGTARNTTSKVWYTVADGVLSDVYYPTVDNTNVETMQLVVSDGATFSDLQARDMTYRAVALGGSGMACRIVSTARSGAYRIVTDYVTDPRRDAVVAHVRYLPLVAAARGFHVYVRLDPSVNGNGGGGSGNGGGDTAAIDGSTGSPILVASDTVTATNAANRDYATPVFAALASSTGFGGAEVGFVGQPSDGLVQLDASHALTGATTEADDGNVALTAQVHVYRSRSFVLALGFASDLADAVQTARSASRQPFARLLQRYQHGWGVYDARLRRPRLARAGASGPELSDLQHSYRVSANALKASEDKTFAGAIVASLASPWGQAVSAGDPANTYFGSYREVFARDLYEAWTGLLADGDLKTARDAVRFLFDRQQQPDGSMPRNSLVNGEAAPDSFGTQLDETAYPILMAYQLGMTSRALYREHVRRAADFVAAHGPAFGVERWEEQSGYSPSTIAAEIAGLVAAAAIADVNGDEASAAVWRGVADDWQRSIKGWTVTTNGPLAPRYFIRLSKTGDPNAAITYNVGNGGPTLDQRAVVDAGFLELVRLGELPADDPDVAASIPVVDATIASSTPCGEGWHRYNGDGYGDGAADGHPWAPSDQGTGHLWPVLAAERGEYELVTGQPASGFGDLAEMRCSASGVGLVPEQQWELPDLPASPFGTPPETASIGFLDGGPAGSAAPLTWSAAAFVRLAIDLGAQRLIETPAATVERYVAHAQGATPVTISSPADESTVDSSPVTVAGTAAPGARVTVAATNTDHDSATTHASTTADPGGGYSVDVAVSPGTSVLNVVSTAADGATGHAEVTVVWDFTPGTKLLDVSDPSGDDAGPGNYAYPTSSNFQPGAFDLEDFQVYDDGTSIVFRVQTRDLTPTFGSPEGAQLVDVYVHDPAAAPGDTSTAASFPQRNYTIDASAAWSRLVEVQGFGQRYVDAHGTTLGTVSISANQISRYITFSVPKASLGQPGPGWGFTVVLTGQDGFSEDQARAFTPTPGEFSFGVCAVASSTPLCAFDPGLVPKAVDVLTPPGVAQSDELDYTMQSPVVLADVTIPPPCKPRLSRRAACVA
jgi:glucan 1,4-alpha-glucosidase